MPISGCPNCSNMSFRVGGHGFTLVEILVVLFIVSIMSGIVVANMPSLTQSGDFDVETRRLKALLETAREEAVLQAQEYGFRPGDEGYRFYAYDDMSEKWHVIETRPLDAHELPEDFDLVLEVEGEAFQLSEAKAPPVLILSSGEMTPFNLTIEQGRNRSRTLASDGYSDLHWLDEEAGGR